MRTPCHAKFLNRRRLGRTAHKSLTPFTSAAGRQAFSILVLLPKFSTHYAPPTCSRLPKSPSKPIPKRSQPKKPNPGSQPDSTESASASSPSTTANPKPPAACTVEPTSTAPSKSSVPPDSKISASISSLACLTRHANRGKHPSARFSICAPNTSRSTCSKWTKAATSAKNPSQVALVTALPQFRPTRHKPNSTILHARVSEPPATTTTRYRTGRSQGVARVTI